MDKTIISQAPYFDALEMRRELTQIFEAQSRAATAARPALLDQLKGLLKTARAGANRQLVSDGNGRRCAEGLAEFQDELIRLVYDYTVAHVYRATNPSDAERMAIIATGGYGRGLLAPYSDIDLLFLLPYKQTPWGESVIEYMLLLLVGSRLEGRPRDAHGRPMHQAVTGGHDHPHHAAGCAHDPRRRGAL